MLWNRTLQFALFLLLMTFTPLAVMAQTDCPAIVQQALSDTDQACAQVGRNQACYGNVLLQATAQQGVSGLTFDKPGALANLTDVQSLQLSPLDADKQQWGIALLKLQASLPDTLPGQNVTVMMFGNVTIKDAASGAASAGQAAAITLAVTASKTVNVRAQPSASAQKVGSLSAADTSIMAVGRNDAGDWLQIQLADGSLGWVSTPLVKVDGDPMTLSVVDASAAAAPTATPAPAATPMQAFYFVSGANDAPCKEAPDSGILVQTPQGAGKVSLSINEVDISLGSTAYVQAQAGGEMTVSVVEGQGEITASQKTVIVPAGTRTRIPLDANGAASGQPSDPEPYVAADLAALPVSHLETAVTVAPALTADEITALFSLQQGQWNMTSQPGAGCVGAFDNYTTTITLSSDGSMMSFGFIPGDKRILYPDTVTRLSPGFYQVITNNYFHDTLNVIVNSPTSLTMEGVIPQFDVNQLCHMTVAGEFVSSAPPAVAPPGG